MCGCRCEHGATENDKITHRFMSIFENSVFRDHHQSRLGTSKQVRRNFRGNQKNIEEQVAQ